MSFELPKGFMGQVEESFVDAGTGAQTLLPKPHKQDAGASGCQAPECPCLALLI